MGSQQQTGNPQQNVAGQLQGNSKSLQPAGDQQVFGIFENNNLANQYDLQTSLEGGGLQLDQNTATQANESIQQKIVEPARNIWQSPVAWGVLTLLIVLVWLVVSWRKRGNIFTR